VYDRAAGPSISVRIRARAAESARFVKSALFSDAQGGKHADSPVPPATYGYMLAWTSRPAARAAAIRAIAASDFSQFRVPAAFR
jgi:hypothetical protein